MTKRTDCHRPGAIVPADYTYVCSYELPGMNGDPGYMQDYRRRCIEADPRPVFFKNDRDNGVGKCDICGAIFRWGDVWQHIPSGQNIHIGHDCADKYALLADRTDWFATVEAHKRATAAAIQAAMNKVKKEKFLAEHPGLEQDLNENHRIINDIAQRFNSYCKISDAQIALVQKLANEVRNPKPEEAHVPAPEGKVVVRGTVVSTKSYDGAFGTSIKMTVKVTTPEGSWLAWGTVPSSLLASQDGLKGKLVEFSATLKQGRDAHFAIFKRPTKAVVVESLFQN